MSTGRPVGDDTTIPTDGRVVAVDLGHVRVGLAVSDPTQTIGSPDETLAVEGMDRGAVAGMVAEAVEDQDGVGVVVGYPRTLEGREGANARRARELAEELAATSGLPVVLWDERMTSVEAERVMIEQDASRGERRQALDRVAAGLILQGWLEARRRETT